MANELPSGARLTSISAHYNELTIPRELLAAGLLPAETWARLVVEKGKVLLLMGGSQESTPVTPDAPALIPAGTEFSLKPTRESSRFYLEYYREARLSDAAELAKLLG
ncbi:MAG: hypothetical protein O7A08_02710 [SAR324 cluster bacterium]|nr:hypothetical protein [SAR324 cluster bacterium]MCZ6556263.1 hypothetical protein [SAR324 cluster bacterium]